jgi:Protein of unknown function (DUF2690)
MKFKIVITNLSLFVFFILPSLFMVAFAEDKYKKCSGKSCDEKDPVEYQCDNKNVKILATKEGKQVGKPGDTSTLIVELRKSENCNSKWVQATVPIGSTILLKDKSGNHYVRKKIDKQGVYKSLMKNADIPLQACVIIPSQPPLECTEIR